MDQETLLAGGFASLLLGALITWVLRGKGARAAISRVVALVSIIGAAGCFVGVAVPVLAEGGRALGPLRLWAPSFVRASVSIRVDALSAFFLLVISLLASVATWYSVGYTRKIKGDVSGIYTPLLLFVFGMAGVVVVNDFFFFFVPWEFMALSSYLLVIFHKEKAENLSAGFKYFFVTHAGTLALFFGVTLLVTSSGSSFGFEDMARSLPALLAARPILAHLALLLVLLGFLVKAGAYPFGMWWLPDAHPAAPSPASALLSGVMIKLGLYGILRVFFSILPPGPWTLPWGLVIGAFGTVSLLVGTLVALLQSDSKRLLAYSSIGQVGYMLLGRDRLGLAPTNPDWPRRLHRRLFHLLNHACFKGLLFLNAGTFELVTGEAI
jgi:hydrogenase-4 component B